jgi:integrase/recombinase XerD
LAYLRAKGLKRSSLANNFSALSNWFDFLVESGKLDINPIPSLKKRYLQTYKDEIRQRQLISVDQATKMVRATIDTRDRAVLLLLLKTGIRRNELVTLDLEDVDLPGQKLTLKPTGKRSNRIVFFDDEAARSLARWISARETRYKKRGEKALFISVKGTRLKSAAVDILVREAAERIGLHDHGSEKLDAKFTPHCCRHFLTTHLLRNNMRREYVQWLRGDAIKEAVDIYFHINPEDVKQNYLACVPEFGI